MNINILFFGFIQDNQLWRWLCEGSGFAPQFEDLINVTVSDELYYTEFPNRDASFLRNGFILSQLDGEGMRAMERQQEIASKQAFKESSLK